MYEHRQGVRCDARVKRSRRAEYGERRTNHFVVRCYDRGGALRWEAEVPHNLVVTEGLNHSISKHFKGSAYTAAWYIGLTGSSPTFAMADTMAAHGGWTEVTAYTEVKRQTLTLGSVAGGSAHNAASKGTFSINAATTVGGAFLATDDAIGSANGTLYGGGAFASGNQTVGSGDSLTVQVTVYAGTA